MTASSGQSSAPSPCTIEEESRLARRRLVVPELTESYAEDLAEISKLRTVPTDARKRILLAHNEILMLRQMLETAKERLSDAVDYIERLERTTRPRGRHALVWGEASEKPHAV